MKAITKEVMIQYEYIKKLGPCNMFNLQCVQKIANTMEFYELAALEKDEYVYILTNFSTLMKKFKITQE